MKIRLNALLLDEMLFPDYTKCFIVIRWNVLWLYENCCMVKFLLRYYGNLQNCMPFSDAIMMVFSCVMILSHYRFEEWVIFSKSHTNLLFVSWCCNYSCCWLLLKSKDRLFHSFSCIFAYLWVKCVLDLVFLCIL